MSNPDVCQITLVGLGSPYHFSTLNNLSIETLAGDLRGHFGKTVDVRLYTLRRFCDIENLMGTVQSQPPPNMIGLSLQIGCLELVESFLGELRKDAKLKDALIVFGNQIPTYFPERMLQMCPGGVVVRGEGELALRGLVQYCSGERDLSEVPNLVWRNEKTGEMVHNRKETPDLSQLHHPPATDILKEILVGNAQIQTSRGCPWGGCAYCTRTSFRRCGDVVQVGNAASWQGFNEARILSHMESILKSGITEIELSDDETTGGRLPDRLQRMEHLVSEIATLRADHKSNLTFRMFTRPDIVFSQNDTKGNERFTAFLRQFRAAGLVNVFLGIEAGNQGQLDRYRRKLRLTDCVEALRILRGLGFGIDVGYIMFDPQVTPEEILENVRFFRDNSLISHNQWPFRPLAINAGSWLEKTLCDAGLLGPLNESFMTYGTVFKSAISEKVHMRIEDLNRRGKTLFYALKIKSKAYFDKGKKDEETKMAQSFIERNGLVYLDFMERLASHLLEEKDISEDICVATARVTAIVKEIEVAVATGELKDKEKAISFGIDIFYSEEGEAKSEAHME